jgi:hypothetical protein
MYPCPTKARRQGESCKHAKWAAIAVLAVAGTTPLRAATFSPNIISSDIRVDTGSIVYINDFVGASRFYASGYTGSYAAVANVEAGAIWNSHEMFSNTNITYFNDPSIGTPANLYDFHATAVGGIIAGLGPQLSNGNFYLSQIGIAPTATLWSGAIASSWAADGTGTFNTTDQAFYYAYTNTMQTGASRFMLTGPNSVTLTTAPADVINSSWGFTDPTGSDPYTIAIDGLARQNHNTVVMAAGNGGGPQVGGPASGFNGISVAALGTDTSTPAYGSPEGFSSSGPNDFYNPQTLQTIAGVRHGIDIAAPGSGLVVPAYIGATGMNTNNAYFGTGLPYPPTENDLYASGAAGTSFASPIVAGGATLLVDAGYQNFYGGMAIDGRVIKAVLLNSADKTAGWNDHASTIGGVWQTSQPLDYTVGSGALDLNRAYDQYLSGTTNTPAITGGTVDPLGWAYGHVAPNTPNDYLINTPLIAGERVTATLTWFVDRTFNADTSTATDVAFDNLFLQLWSVQGGVPTTMLAESDSLYDNLQQIYFTLPATGYYDLRVVWDGRIYNLGETGTGQDYAMAWSAEVPAIPEPASFAILAIPALAILLRRRHG